MNNHKKFDGQIMVHLTEATALCQSVNLRLFLVPQRRSVYCWPLFFYFIDRPVGRKRRGKRAIYDSSVSNESSLLFIRQTPTQRLVGSAFLPPIDFPLCAAF